MADGREGGRSPGKYPDTTQGDTKFDVPFPCDLRTILGKSIH